MPTMTIFDDGIIQLYTRDESTQRYLTLDELIDILAYAGIIEAGVIISIPLLGALFVNLYNKVKQYNETANRTPEGYYTGKLPEFQSNSVFRKRSSYLSKSVLEIKSIYPTTNNEAKYTFNNKWIFPELVIFTYHMYMLKGDDGKDKECRCKQQGDNLIPR
jgi:hypothetical protein